MGSFNSDWGQGHVFQGLELRQASTWYDVLTAIITVDSIMLDPYHLVPV